MTILDSLKANGRRDNTRLYTVKITLPGLGKQTGLTAAEKVTGTQRVRMA
jgi:hypothetical protein